MAALADYLLSYSSLGFHMAIQVALALSIYLNLKAGLLNLGVPGFMAIGAYAAALLTRDGGWPLVPAVTAGSALAAAVAWLVGRPVLRLQGVYFAIATVSLSELVRMLALNWELVGQAMGLKSIPRLTELWHAGLFVVVLLYGLWTIERSQVGRALAAIGLDETAAGTMGIPAPRLKLAAFCASAVIAAVAGGLHAHHSYILSPGEFSFHSSLSVLLYAIVGGTRTLWGPVLGAVVLTALPEVFRPLKDLRMLVYGVSLLLVVVYLPNGLIELFRLSGVKRAWQRFSG